LLLYREPDAPGMRIDAGVAEGSRIGVNYDPLLAKLIAYGETRDAARLRAIGALRSYPILGIRTNVPFLAKLLAHPDFVSGRAHTGFVEDRLAELVTDDVPAEALAAAVVTMPAEY